ncbi:MAG: ABC transporter substrate-binding protein, partial [Clostridia bacterium]|nr:ABC transporter substrate-binding protein [Clostridia bacterium]
KNGEYSRLHPAVVSGCYLLSSTKRAQEGWEFLKWWMSAETQNNFATRLQTTYGEEYLWITANREALAQTTVFADQDREVLLVQLESLKEIPSHPATMLVQRALSDAWNRVVFNGEDVRSALDTAQLEADRGIRKKLQQFGLIDESGTVVRTLWQEEEP